VGLQFWDYLIAVVGAAIGAGVSAVGIARLVARFGRRHGWCWVQAELDRCGRPWVAAVVTVAIAMVVQRFPILSAEWRRSAWIPAIPMVCWMLVHSVRVVEVVLLRGRRVDAEPSHTVRRARTRIAMLRRLAVVLTGAFGLAGVVLLLPGLPAVGASLFASAGLAGIIAGLAAQATLANVFAGIQLACTDAVRIDDVVVVEGEWGWIEEITLTYIVVRIWDERRLVLPTSYFTTTPFQNWTRHKAELLGSVILHLDYATPLTALREHARRVIEASPLWDRKGWVLQVTNTTETTMVVRVLASSKDGPTSWDLCCDIREALLVFLQEQHPQALPVRRFVTLPGALKSQHQEDIQDEVDPVAAFSPSGGPVTRPAEPRGPTKPVDLTELESRAESRPLVQGPRRAELRRAERSALRSRSAVPAARRVRELRRSR
jgi:small-conductance mechanosensitive channel